MSLDLPPPRTLAEVVRDARFAARAAAFATITGVALARLELETRDVDDRERERIIALSMRRFGRVVGSAFGIETVTSGVGAEGYVSGRDARGLGRVFVCNHRSALDILVTLKLLEGKHVSRADLADWPVLGVVARKVGILFVDRESKRSAAAVVHQMIRCVGAGIGVIIFPEGTTYAGDEVRPFKPGAFAVAKRTGCEVVPVGIAYGGDSTSFGDESLVEHMRRVAGGSRTRVALAVGSPLKMAPAEEAQALSERVHAAVQRQVSDARALLGGLPRGPLTKLS